MRICKHVLLGIVGGLIYGLLEVAFRGFTHVSMVILGGACFIAIGLLNELYTWDMALTSQMMLSSIIITAGELAVGLIVNVWLGLGVWDYSTLPYNLFGQISLLWSCVWFALSLPAILLDDFLRWKWFGEERPHYKIL